MEKKSKDVLRKHKKARPASSSESSSSSDSDSGSTSDSYSSSSSDKKAAHRKGKKVRVRRSSSSTDEDRTRKREKHACHRKLEAKKNHLKRKLKEAKAKKRGASPGMRRRSTSPQKPKKIIPPAGSSAEKKHHQLILKERMLKEKEREREREKVRLGRDRIPPRPGAKEQKSRSPSKVVRCRGEMKRKSPMGVERHHQISPREKIIIQARRDRSPNERIKGPKDVRHRLDDRRERERAEAARQKEREEALARCQERQRERERVAREKMMRRDKDYDRDRLLPRPAEREMAIAAARAANSRERSIEQPDGRRTGHSHSGHTSRQGRGEGGYDRAAGSFDREREFPGHNDGHRSLERDDRRGGGNNVNEMDREYVMMRRRDVSSPPGNSGHYSDRQRGSDREIYPDDDRYDRDNYQPQRGHSRNYMQPNDDGQQHHRRGGDRGNGAGNNWDQQGQRDHEERGNEHHDKHFQEKLMGRSGDWKSNKNEWMDSQHWDDKNWQQRKKPLPLIQNDDNWEDEDGYPGSLLSQKKGDWIEPAGSISGRGKHEHGRDEHGPIIPGSNQHEGGSHQGQHQHTGTGRRWQQQQEWRGRGPNDSRQIHGSGPGQAGQGNFRHNTPLHPHPMDYNHDRPDFRRQQHSHHPTHLQHHHAGGYHHQPRPHFPSKRQMTYTNPNLLKAQQAAAAAVATSTVTTPQASSTPPAISCASSNAAPIDVITKVTTTPIIEVSPNPVELQDKVIVATTIIAATNATTTDTPDKNSEIISEIASPVISEPETTIDDPETNAADVTMEEMNTATNNPVDESIPDDLSEISDEADEILNKDEELSVTKNFDNDVEGADMMIADDSQSQENTKDDLIFNSEGGDTQGDPIDKDLNDDLLDFEEISDGELEEESRKNLGDALGVDWASLVKDTKVHGREPSEEQHTTAKQKWQPHRIILDVGISFKYAGEDFAKRILNDAKQKLEAEQAILKSGDEDDENEIRSGHRINSDVKIKMEKEDIEDFEMTSSSSPDIKNEDVAFKDSSNNNNNNNLLDNDKLSGIACVQVAARRTKEIRRNLIFHACGPNSRALSARRDLNLRRQLVGLPITKIVRPRNVSDRMKALALKAFQDAVAAEAT